MEITIQELGETGDYEAVEIINKPDVPSVGIFQLKQVWICLRILIRHRYRFPLYCGFHAQVAC